MSKDRGAKASPPENAISIIGPGMRVVGDCEVEGALRVEGSVQGNIRAGKAVVVGRDGVVEGDISTQDAVVAGTVRGTLRADSCLEVQATSRIEGQIVAAKLQLEEGAILNGTVQMGNASSPPPESSSSPSTP
jgi:cytoskeletal protein CcmA (bactofilin family)